MVQIRPYWITRQKQANKKDTQVSNSLSKEDVCDLERGKSVFHNVHKMAPLLYLPLKNGKRNFIVICKHKIIWWFNTEKNEQQRIVHLLFILIIYKSIPNTRKKQRTDCWDYCVVFKWKKKTKPYKIYWFLLCLLIQFHVCNGHWIDTISECWRSFRREKKC